MSFCPKSGRPISPEAWAAHRLRLRQMFPSLFGGNPMDHKQVQDIASKHGYGTVHFEYRVAQNTGREFEVGYVSKGRHRELFCKRSPDSNPDQFYLCNEYAKLEEKPTRDEMLEEIAINLLRIHPEDFRKPEGLTERIPLVDLKQALQLAYKAGQDSANEKGRAV